MSELEIITDHKWKEFKYDHEVPKKVRENDFDWLDKDVYDGFIKYRNRWYHSSEFMRLDKNSPFPSKWHGYHSDSFFSGVLIEMSDCGEGYRIATYIS